MARFNNGWIKVYRSLGEGDLVQNPILLALWFRLLTWATWKPSKILWRGKQREIPPGSVVFGMNQLAEEWECSTDTISRWTQYLRETARINYETSRRGSLVTILNWELYQSNDDDDRTEIGQSSDGDRTLTVRRPVLSEEEKKGRTKKEDNTLPPLAEIWNQNRGDLPQVLGCKNTRLKAAKARWQEKPDKEYWSAIVRRLAASSFCQGAGKDGWRASFDFLLQPDTQHKALEGKYDERLPRTNGTGPVISAEVKAEMAELEKMRKDCMEGRL